MGSAIRVVTRVQDQDDYSSTGIDTTGQVLGWNQSTGKWGVQSGLDVAITSNQLKALIGYTTSANDSGTGTAREASIKFVSNQAGGQLGILLQAEKVTCSDAFSVPLQLDSSTSVGYTVITNTWGVMHLESGVKLNLANTTFTSAPPARFTVEVVDQSKPAAIFRPHASQVANLVEFHDNSNLYASGVAPNGRGMVATGAGAPGGTPVAGETYLDTTNSRIYFGVGGTWKYAALT